jgi:membrane-associated phospholipid phosphatase
MALLGWAVGDGSTPLDDWFQRGRGGVLGRLLFFTDYRVVAVLLLGAVAVALYRLQWQLVAAMVIAPVVAVWIAQVCKQWFGRWKEGAVAYPSGHTTLMVVILGMVILVAGARLWVVAASIVFGLLGMLGQAVTYHYFTDTVGAVLLGTSVVCVAATIVRWGHSRAPG